MTFVASTPPVVVDASAAIEFLEGNPAWASIFDAWAAEDRMLLGPTLVLAEVANGQLRGRRANAASIRLRLERLVASGLETVDRGLADMTEAVDLADRHGLTVYDALYLQLALDVEGELATLDSDLQRAAIAEDVFVIGPKVER